MEVGTAATGLTVTVAGSGEVVLSLSRPQTAYVLGSVLRKCGSRAVVPLEATAVPESGVSGSAPPVTSRTTAPAVPPPVQDSTAAWSPTDPVRPVTSTGAA